MTAPPQSSLLICVTGAECTGKTSIAQHLAETLNVPLVSEMARSYLDGRRGYGPEDVLAIAQQQLSAEAAALASSPLAVADTDLTVIQVWWEEKYGELHPWIAGALAHRSPRCYLLPRPDLPWVPDPLRESPHDRQRLHQRYRQVLDDSEFPFAEVEGLGEVRQERALAIVDGWLSEIRDRR